jgi:hypothetical protein
MSDLQIDCQLPEVAKRLTPWQREELVEAMSFCTWNAIQGKLGDLVSEKSALFTTDRSRPSISFKMSTPSEHGLRTAQEVQLLWDGLQKLVDTAGVHSFLIEYRGGRYGGDSKARSNVNYRLISDDEAKEKAKAIRPLDFTEDNDYAVALLAFDVPTTSFKQLRIHGAAQCARCNGLVSFVCNCFSHSSGSNSQPCPRCQKPMYISAGRLNINDEACKEIYVMAGMTDHLKAEPVASLVVHSVKQVTGESYPS